MAVDCKVVRVTPAVAASWLELNTANFRTVDKARVQNYADEMRRGRWEMNGEAIKFNSHILLDGQHRLHAVISSGCAVDMLVVRNIEASPATLDRGRPRSVAQWLQYSGIRQAPHVAAIARCVVAHDKGMWKGASWGVGCMTDSEVIDIAKGYSEEIIEATNYATRVKFLPVNALGAVLFLGSGRTFCSQNQTASWFVGRLIDGIGLAETDPVLHLRNRVSNLTGSNTLSRFTIRMLITLAWNKTVLGESIGVLRLVTTGPKAMTVPNRVLVAE